MPEADTPPVRQTLRPIASSGATVPSPVLGFPGASNADYNFESSAEVGFALPPYTAGHKPNAKKPSPAGVLFSGAMLDAGRTLLPLSPKVSQVGIMGEAESPTEGEPFIRLGGLSDHMEGILRCRRIVFIACGTSHHACLAARKTLEEFANMPVVVELAGDFMVRISIE
jgi:hypothetical protein